MRHTIFFFFLVGATRSDAFVAQCGGVGAARSSVQPGSPLLLQPRLVDPVTVLTASASSSEEPSTSKVGAWLSTVVNETWEEEDAATLAAIIGAEVGEKVGSLLLYDERDELKAALESARSAAGAKIKGGDVQRILKALETAYTPAWASSTSGAVPPGAAPRSPSPPRQMLGADDFLPIPEFNKRSVFAMTLREDITEVPFVGGSWREETLSAISPEISKSDDTSNTKVRPGALTGHSRAGKSRALRELVFELREKGYVVILISFNDRTPFFPGEAPSLRESLLVRMAAAMAKESAIPFTPSKWCPLHDVNSKLRYTTTADDVLEHLKGQKCVLFIDELNRCVDPMRPEDRPPEEQVREVMRFLNGHFACAHDRYYVFTTHKTNTTKLVHLVEGSSTDRTALALTMPTIQSRDDVETLKATNFLLGPISN